MRNAKLRNLLIPIQNGLFFLTFWDWGGGGLQKPFPFEIQISQICSFDHGIDFFSQTKSILVKNRVHVLPLTYMVAENRTEEERGGGGEGGGGRGGREVKHFQLFHNIDMPHGFLGLAKHFSSTFSKL